MKIDVPTLNKALGNVDIYLLDQILKGAYTGADKVLDAGCGEGRNSVYFLNNGCEIFGIDSNPSAIRMLRFVAASINPSIDRENFSVGTLEELPYDSETFDLVICSAVLHFARDADHFATMFNEICRVLKPGGNLFIRTATSVGIEDKIISLGSGCYHLPDGSNRFLLHLDDFKTIPAIYGLAYSEPFKVVNVEGKRCMSTLLFKKD